MDDYLTQDYVLSSFIYQISLVLNSTYLRFYVILFSRLREFINQDEIRNIISNNY